jgi:Flp pilus assembly pilin Flp
MKLTPRTQPRRAIAMTEYLIILAIVAIAAIAVIGLFGKQIKSVFTRSNQALVGQTGGADTGTSDASKNATKQDNMGTFDKSASKGDNK